jgi:nucleoside-diphosphate-sugar epimerase
VQGTNELTVDDPSVVFSDAQPEKIDALDDSRPHRWVDVLIYKAIKSGEYKDKARMAIMMPPLVYGVSLTHINFALNPCCRLAQAYASVPYRNRLTSQQPAKRDTYQIPNLIRLALKHGYAGYVDSGEGRQTNIHVSDLARAFIYVLDQLKRERDGGAQSDNLYYFPEHGQDKVHVWKELARRIAAILQERGKIQTGPEDIRSFPKEVMEQDMNGRWLCAL